MITQNQIRGYRYAMRRLSKADQAILEALFDESAVIQNLTLNVRSHEHAVYTALDVLGYRTPTGIVHALAIMTLPDSCKPGKKQTTDQYRSAWWRSRHRRMAS